MFLNRGISVLRNYNSSPKTLKTNAVIMIVFNTSYPSERSVHLYILIYTRNIKHKVHEPGMYMHTGDHVVLSMLHLLKYVSVLF